VLTGTAAETLACVLLAAVIVTAVRRPAWLPEAAVAVLAAAILLLTGALPLSRAHEATTRLLPVLGFLAAILVLAWLCERAGLFRAAGARLAAASGGRPGRLLAGVFGLASVTTAVLSLDTTVVLLTPVVDETAGRLGVARKPPVFACAHLANSASLLLPVSNLTNLLAFAGSGLTLGRFTALMTLPWLAAIAVEYVGFRLFFARDLRSEPEPGQNGRIGPKAGQAAGAEAQGPEPEPEAEAEAGTGQEADTRTEQEKEAEEQAAELAAARGAGAAQPGVRPGTDGLALADRAAGSVAIPYFVLAVVLVTLAGFVVTSAAGLNPAWAALAGVCVLGGRDLFRRQVTLAGLVRSASVPFLLFVLGLGLVVEAVTVHGLGHTMGRLIPAGSSLAALLAVAGLAAVLANVVNNLPAVLIMLSALGLAGVSGSGPLLALLIGVNIGPNLTYPGSLANLLWRRLLASRGTQVSVREFTRLGLLTGPAAIVSATVALWAGLRV
jgi:arsenical pump membrane protein